MTLLAIVPLCCFNVRELLAKMRLKLTVELVLIASTGFIIVSLLLVILWSGRRSTTPSQSTQILTVNQHQQPQRTKKMKNQEDTGNDAAANANNNVDKIGPDDGGDDDEEEADDDAEIDTKTNSDRMPPKEEIKRIWPNQTKSLLRKNSSLEELRRKHLELECHRRGMSSRKWSKMPALMLVSDRFKVLYCMIGKVASSAWKKVFLVAAGKISPSRVGEFQYRRVGSRALSVLRPMSGRHSELNRQRISTYFKFMFVRHPLDRLLSAFREKFRVVPHYMQTYGRHIIRRYRANASAESLKRGHDVTLEEFVRFMVDTGLRYRLDVHWTAQSVLCRPCSISYDFIGHFETLWSDADHVLQQLNIRSDVTFPRWTNNRADNERYDIAFANVKTEYITRLRKLYSQDYDLFGYT